ncbi:hypothetical protein BGZ63DRAFT_373096 [Mariannaea sp. PMI_226]|nr:hypothetical protein BGZ63DRAFT_373096 [Mariannaea sp. PMI_226]
MRGANMSYYEDEDINVTIRHRSPPRRSILPIPERVYYEERIRSPSVRRRVRERERYVKRYHSPSIRYISPTREMYEERAPAFTSARSRTRTRVREARPLVRNYHELSDDGVRYRERPPSTVYSSSRASFLDRRMERYSPFTYEKLETEGLSMTYMIPRIVQQANDLTEGTINSQWQDFESTWDDQNDGHVSLHVVHSSEYSINKDGREKIKLVCPARIETVPAESAAIQMKWIHLKRHCLRFDILKKLVVKSPFIAQELRQVAGKVLEEVHTSHSHESENGQGFHPEQGSVFRCIGKHDAEGTSETPPVVFVSSSYLVLSKKASLSGLDKGHYMMGLLQSLYGFDVGGDQQHLDVARKMDLGAAKEELHVPQLWCLLVGSDLLITFSELSLEELRANLIEIDLKASLLEKPLTLRVMDDNMRRYNIVIDAGSNYVDFLRDAVALARRPGSDATDYDLLDENMDTITPRQWLKLLKSGNIEQTTLYIVPKILHQSRHRARSRRREYSRDPREYYDGEGVYEGDIVRHEKEDLEEGLRRYRPEERTVVRREVSPPNPGPEISLPRSRYSRTREYEGSGARRELSPRNSEPGVSHPRHQGDVPEAEDDVPPDAGGNYTTAAEPENYENMQLIRRPNTFRRQIDDGHIMTEQVSRGPLRRGSEDHTQEIGLLERVERSRSRSASSARPPIPQPIRVVSRRETKRHQSPGRVKGKELMKISRSVRGYNPIVREREAIRETRIVRTPGERVYTRTTRNGKIINGSTYRPALPEVFNFQSSDGALETDDARKSTEIDQDAESRTFSSRGRGRERRVNRSSRYQYSISDSDSLSDSTSQSLSRERVEMRSDGEIELDKRHLGVGDDSSTFDRDIDENAGKYPGPGNTRIPSHLVSIRAIHDLGYPFKIEGDAFVLPMALGPQQVAELLEISRKYRDYSPSTESPSAGIMKRPFFTWTPKIDQEGANVLDSDQTAVRVLSWLHKLISDGRIGRLYDLAYLCTMDDLLRRHEYLRQIEEQQPTEEPVLQELPVDEIFPEMEKNDQSSPDSQVDQTASSAGSHAEEKLLPEDTSIKGEQSSTKAQKATVEPKPVEVTDEAEDQPPPKAKMVQPLTTPEEEKPQPNQNPRSSSSGSEKQQATLTQERHSVQMFHQHHVVMKRLIEVSQDLLWEFLPKEGSVLVHQISKRFWGSVDGILRQVAWSLVNTQQSVHWTIREFPAPPETLGNLASGTTFSDCEACTTRAQYCSPAEALEHLHSQHMQCPNSGKSEKPYDDPCFALMQPSKEFGDDVKWKTFIEDIERFIESLLKFKALTYELHCLVATPSPRKNTLDSNLSLPRNLVYAFEEIVSMYIMMAKELSILNQARLGTTQKRSRDLDFKATRMLERREEACRSAMNLLEASKNDIILLGTTPRSLEILGLDAIGPEFLVAALAISLQNRPILRDTSTGAIEVYQKYMSKLRYQASRRPQRRIFLEIHTLEDELEALAKLVSSQETGLRNYKDLLCPDSYRITNTTREGLFDVESRYIDTQMKKLGVRRQEIQVLKGKATILKEQVKQTIEILEEGHGKAIRVFTIVTLFFLPLSFTSGFFGMNTTDIRDMEQNQRIFWTISIPLTIGVFTLAFLYGYKGDAIQDSISSTLHSRKIRQQQKQKQQARRQKQPIRVETWQSAISAMEEEPVKSNGVHVQSWFGQGKRVRWNRKSGQDLGAKGVGIV